MVFLLLLLTELSSLDAAVAAVANSTCPIVVVVFCFWGDEESSRDRGRSVGSACDCDVVGPRTRVRTRVRGLVRNPLAGCSF